MKSRTSYSKLTTFRKDLTRYAPVWALYIVGLVLYVLADGGSGYADSFAKRSMSTLISAFGVVNLIYGGICAMTLYGDLFRTKLCYSLHALPQRRESWLISHFSAGMLFSLVPNLLLTVFFMLRLQEYWFLAFYWLLAVQIQFLFFFSLGTLSAMLTGNRFAMLLVYALINFAAMLAFATVNQIYIPMMEGVYLNRVSYSRFSPVVRLFGFTFFEFHSTKILTGEFSWDGQAIMRTSYVYDGLGNGWGYLAILAVVGLGILALSWWLYRKRHLECAGDFLAFPRLKAVACVVLTACVALCFAAMGTIVSSDGYVIWLMIGLVVGFFGGLMLLERRVKVFRKKSFLSFVAMACVVILSLVCVGMDWLGIQSWTPNANMVSSVTVYNYLPNLTYTPRDSVSATLEDQEDIEAIIKAHEDILSRIDQPKNDPNLKTHRVTLEYKMKSGRVVQRSYNAPANGVNYEIITRYLYTIDSVLGFQQPEDIAGRIEHMYLDGVQVYPEFYLEALQALEMDYAAGHVFHSQGKGENYFEYTYIDEYDNYHYRTLLFDQEATHIFQLMRKPALMLGFEKPEYIAGDIDYMILDGMEVPANCYVDVLRALQKDCTEGHVFTNIKYSQTQIEYAFMAPDGNYRYYSLNIGEDATHIPAVMQGKSLVLGYQDRTAFISGLAMIYCDDQWIHGSEWHLLLEMMERDVENGVLQWGSVHQPKCVIRFEFEDGRVHEVYIPRSLGNTLTWLEDSEYI